MRKLSILLSACFILAATAAFAQATTINWHSGEQQLSSPSDLYHAQFMLTETRTVLIYTDSGTHFDAGVFLWDENKNFLEANEDGYAYNVDYNGHSQNVHPFDGYIEITLDAGNYYMSLVPLLDGEYADTMDFSTMDELIAYREGKPLADLGQYYDGSGLFSFHVLNVDTAGPYNPNPPAVPIPATALLLAPILAGVAVLRRKFS